WRRVFFGSIVDALVRGSGEIDIYVISGDGTPPPTPRRRVRPRASEPVPYAAALATALASTALAWLMFPRFELSNIIMVYLLGVVVVSMRFGRVASALASVLSVAAFDFFFVPPYFTFAVTDSQYLVTFNMDASDHAVAQWAFEHRAAAGAGTDNLPGAQMRFEPLTSSRGIVGVVGMRPTEPRAFDAPEQERLLETFVSQVAVALDRALLAAEMQAAQVRAESERVRNALLSAVSHDLRTPLTAITGAAIASLEGDTRLDAAKR